MLLSIHLSMIIHYTVEQKSFFVTVYKLFVQKLLKSHVNDSLKLMVNKRFRCLRKVNMLKSNILKKIK